MESFWKDLFSFASVQLFAHNTLILLQIFRRSNWTWKVNGRLQFQKDPHQFTKALQGRS